MTGCIIVAAGYGSFRTEAGREVPKIIESVRGLPAIAHCIAAAEKAGLKDSVVVVNPRDEDLVIAAIYAAMRRGAFSRMPSMVRQPDRYGAADAVRRAIPPMRVCGQYRALITYADMPMWSAETMRLVVDAAESSGGVVTMATVPRDPQFPGLHRYGRVVRDSAGRISRIVEVNDPAITDEIRDIDRVNPSLWVWDLPWLDRMIPHSTLFRKTDGHPDERHMPPLIEMAHRYGYEVHERPFTNMMCAQARGIDSPETLAALQ